MRSAAVRVIRWQLGLTFLLVVTSAACGGDSGDEQSASTAGVDEASEETVEVPFNMIFTGPYGPLACPSIESSGDPIGVRFYRSTDRGGFDTLVVTDDEETSYGVAVATYSLVERDPLADLPPGFPATYIPGLPASDPVCFVAAVLNVPTADDYPLVEVAYPPLEDSDYEVVFENLSRDEAEEGLFVEYNGTFVPLEASEVGG